MEERTFACYICGRILPREECTEFDNQELCSHCLGYIPFCAANAESGCGRMTTPAAGTDPCARTATMTTMPPAAGAAA